MDKDNVVDFFNAVLKSANKHEIELGYTDQETINCLIKYYKTDMPTNKVSDGLETLLLCMSEHKNKKFTKSLVSTRLNRLNKILRELNSIKLRNIGYNGPLFIHVKDTLEFKPRNIILDNFITAEDENKVSEIYVGKQISKSPFNLEGLLKYALKHKEEFNHLLIVGQDLSFFSKDDTGLNIRNTIIEFLKANPDINKVDLLIHDLGEGGKIEPSYFVQAWNDMLNKKAHIDDLDKTIWIFRKWLSEIKHKHNKIKLKTDAKQDDYNLAIKLLPHLNPITINFLFNDKLNDGEGIMVLIPIMPQEIESGKRPHYVVSKKDLFEVYNFYYSKYSAIFNTESLKLVLPEN